MIVFNEMDRKNKIEEQRFDLLIATLGYETRSSFISLELKGQYDIGVCLAFTNQQELSFQANKNHFEALGFTINDWEEKLNKDLFSKLFYGLQTDVDNEIKIAIDVSSMNRSMAAQIIYYLVNEIEIPQKLKITILYAPAKFTKPFEEVVEAAYANAVTRDYAGWYDNPDDPLHAVVGLGYEKGKAIGALEYLDISNAWLFKPISDEKRYENEIDKTNNEIIRLVGNDRLIDYDLLNPYDTLIKARSLIEGLIKNGRVTILPFGPKLFNCICLIVAELYRPKLAIWRVSAGHKEEPKDSVPNGEIVSFTFNVV